jgi:hypothetical protein
MGSIEEYIYEGALTAVGDPILLGLCVFGFFLGFVTLQGQSLVGKISIIVPATFLALAFLPSVATVLVGLVFGFILYLALMRLLSR